jgi:hypothetical protein
MSDIKRRRTARQIQAQADKLEAQNRVERGRAEAAAYQATLARARYHLLEERAVKHGRSAGVSWDELGRWLICPGETVRRRYMRETEG